MPRIRPPLVDSSTWIAHEAGPIARDALDAIGRPYEGGDIQIDVVGEHFTLNGVPVTQADASLVYQAWQCDPAHHSPEPAKHLVDDVRRAITIRRMLALALAGTGE